MIVGFCEFGKERAVFIGALSPDDELDIEGEESGEDLLEEYSAEGLVHSCGETEERTLGFLRPSEFHLERRFIPHLLLERMRGIASCNRRVTDRGEGGHRRYVFDGEITGHYSGKLCV